MNIAISGASGFIGTHLSAFLQKQGHCVYPLTRQLFEEKNYIQLEETIAQCQIAINLSGAPINHRWTSAYKQELYASRIIPTQQIVKAINHTNSVALFISTSAVGYYPSTGCYDEEYCSEENDFLPQLCRAWETEALKVKNSVRLVITRLGVVLAEDGGIFKLFSEIARGKIVTVAGKGSQPFTWIDLEDLVQATLFFIEHSTTEGVFNLVAPEQISNTQFAGELARHGHALLRIKIPSFFFRLLYGESAQLLIKGQCVSPTRLIAAGFTFKSPTIRQFLDRCSDKQPTD